MVDGLSFSYCDCYAAICRVHPSSDVYRSAVAEAFKCKTVGAKYKLKKVVFWLHKNGNPTGHVVARLYNMTGTYGSTGKPTGSPLATSELIDISQIGSGTGEFTFIFVGGQQYVMLKDQAYCITMEVHDGNVDPNNNIQAASVTNPNIHDGNGAHYKNGSWYPDPY